MKAKLVASFLAGLGATLALGLGTLTEPSAPVSVSQLGGALQRLLSIDDASAAPVAASRCDDACHQKYDVTVVDVMNRIPRQ